MSQQVGPLRISVICYDKAGSHGVTPSMQSFQKLNSFGAWRCTHVQDRVMVLNVKHRDGNHWNLLLSEKFARLWLINQKAMKGFQLRMFAQFNPRKFIEAVYCFVERIPPHNLRNLGDQVRIGSQFVQMLPQPILCTLSILIDRINAKANVEWLLQLSIEGLPLVFINYCQLFVVALKLRILPILLRIDSTIIFLVLFLTLLKQLLI